jgi:hypothetical protein
MAHAFARAQPKSRGRGAVVPLTRNCGCEFVRLTANSDIARIVGGEAMKFGGWQRLNAEYAKQFGVATRDWSTNAPKP